MAESHPASAPVSHDRISLFLLGFLTLFLELALIRFLAGNIWNLGYFPNLVLIGAFVGIGTGFLFSHRFSQAWSRRLLWCSALVLLVLGVLATLFHPTMPGFQGWQGEFAGELFFTTAPKSSAVTSYSLFVIWFALVIGVFFSISQRTGQLFATFPPLTAYTLDIFGSLSGIALFIVISWLRLPAYSWFLMAVPIYLYCLRAAPGESPAMRRLGYAISVVCLVGVTALSCYQDTKLLVGQDGRGEAYRGPVTTQWSPYQKVEFVNNERIPHQIFVNGVPHQHMATAEQVRATYYQEPHRARRQQAQLPAYENVLILGAGAGNDVYAALANGAKHVDAVEIDPVIAALGREHHPAGPYKDPRVTLHVGDGRAFLTQATRRYDLILFALTDSLVKVSPMAQLRLENYLFTEESLRRAYGLLAENGDLVLYNFYRTRWLIDKLARMMALASGREPALMWQRRDFAVLAVGKHERYKRRMPIAAIDVARDDWPFLYLKQRGIPPIYLGALLGLGTLVLLALFALERGARKTARGRSQLSLKIAFMLMGVAFLLLETKSVIQFSLLFGTTWFNNSLVFFAILLLVLAANWVAYTVRSTKLIWPIFGLLIASCAAVLIYPLSNLLAIESILVRFCLASLLTFAPIFFANLIFSVTFRAQKTATELFGWNLIGATLGGLVEYASMATGYDALTYLVAGCYTAVVILLAHDRKQTA